MRWHLQGLWKNSDFLKLWLGRSISNMGNGITGIALPLTAVLVLSATPMQMGFIRTYPNRPAARYVIKAQARWRRAR